MKPKTATQTQKFVARVLNRLASPSGQRALRMANKRSVLATEPLRKAREVTPSNLHRRFTV